ncbi:MAG: von Willebrand factor type A domain-containing protein [bacterium]
MKRLITLGIALTAMILLLAVSSAQMAETGEIRGRVTDAGTGKPIPYASVVIEGTNIGTVTDTTGAYLLLNVPPGSHNLLVQALGFAEKRVSGLTVTDGQTTVQDFALESAALDLSTTQIVTTDLVGPQPDEALKIRGGRAEVLAQIANQGEFKKLGFEAEYGNACSGIVNGNGYPPAHGGNAPPNGEPFDAMFFDHSGVNPFVSTEDDHLSTFAIDVDNASYTMTRSYLGSGNLPPDDAVRVEEFVNNFKYSFRHPQEEAFDIVMEGAPSRFGENYQMLKVSIVGKEVRPENRKDANLVFVVDVSGSMSREDRLGLVRRSLRMLVDNLTDRDRVGIVAYGSNAFVVLEPTSVHDENRIIAAIEKLYSGGSTNAEEGIRMGYDMAEQMFESGKINRVILCSDGVANVGRTSADDFLKMIKSKADKGITLSTIGFGMGNYNDIMMEKLGDKGNGHYAYVDSWDEARRVFMDNLTGTLQVIARDVKIQVDFNPDKVDRYRLLGYENRDVEDDKFRDDKEDGGEIGSGHQVTALYEIKLKEGATGELGRVYVRFKDPDSFAVSEVSQGFDGGTFKSDFDNASADFKLAAAAAEFSEILRNSYWAKGGKLSEVLEVARQVEHERSTPEVIELMDLIAKADKFKQANESEEVLSGK